MTRIACAKYECLPEISGLVSGNNELLHGLFLDVEQHYKLANLVKVDDTNAKKIMVANNLQLVANIVRQYANRGVEFLDLIREGTLGLIHALDKFDKEGGFRFSTYARWCIRENIERAVRSRNNTCIWIKPSWRVCHVTHNC